MRITPRQFAGARIQLHGFVDQVGAEIAGLGNGNGQAIAGFMLEPVGTGDEAVQTTLGNADNKSSSFNLFRRSP
ncbi:hypothetical protein SPHINGOAX6_70929 [Sphingomonas sp. AX6]|nr:hypothetical protein SPHINGOAX6_70929 [Sphingomonas sp. AX6]